MTESVSGSPAVQPTSGSAIVALLLGSFAALVLIVSRGPIATLLGLAAVGCAIVSLRLISKGRADGRSMAIAGLALGIVGTLGGLSAIPSATTPAAATPATTYTAPRYYTAPAPAAPAAPTATSIPGDGTFFVNTEITPGTYRTAGAKQQAFTFCQFSRLRGTTGGSGDTISWATASANDPSVITIMASDQAFKTSGCEQWVKVK